MRQIGGQEVENPQEATQEEQQRHVIILHCEAAQGPGVDLVFRRGDLSRLLAFPNEPDKAVEVAILVEEL